MASGRLLLLDSASLYYRAFFGVPDTFKAQDGTVVNALRGLLDFVATLTARYEPDAVVACWDDDWRPQWRVDLLPSYKTHRLADGEDVGSSEASEETPDLLSPQVPLIAEALGLVGIPVVGAHGAEADDVIGTLAPAWDGPVDVCTGDRDLFQLVDDAQPVRVLYTARGVGNHDVVDNAWIRDKYGIDAAQYADFATMRGDTSDGIPGVAGIGDKTAAVLLAEFGDLDGILAAAADPGSSVKPRVRQNLLDSADLVAAMRQVVRVRDDAVPTEVLVREPLSREQRDAITAFGEQWSLGGVPERLVTALG
ncbi:5'-3' exonuclease [Aeromicrobium sp. Root495]|uniref:5'-3' exonuclease n=1 Tax=Aeromicrobium sp. Root495 TaxID=1736550 RepID=UPI0006F27C99|nr:5'-3' exonuclease [Aeromicrobium sp. Root495]KQY59277.1 5'-3' exonuclease [Aeromicrobium sp. Root495]